MSDPGVRLAQLASHGGGALALTASDEFFGAKERLVLDGAPSPPGAEHTERGKRVDGWETRRVRGASTSDWCVVRLAAPAVLEEASLDTRGFGANAPATWWLEGCDADETDVLTRPETLTWATLLEERSVTPDAVDGYALASTQRVSHVRLWISPDGGVARLRVFGHPLTEPSTLADHAGRAELAAVPSGGRVAGCSDEAFAGADPLGWLAGPATPADGWETRRRREPGREWVVIRLAAEAEVERVDVDTTHFIGNAPAEVAVDVGVGDGPHGPAEREWHADAATVAARPHQRHRACLPAPVVGTHLRLRLRPDGGLARVTAHGRITPAGWQRQQLAVLNWAGADHATAVVHDLCPSAGVASALLARRPYDSVDDLQQAADAVLAELGEDHLVDAASAHPRIGAAGLSGRSRTEQRDVHAGDADARAQLAERAEAYEHRFGFRFLVDAPGRTTSDLLEEIGQRLAHSRDDELARARQELARITRRRIADWARRPEGATG